MDNHCLMLLVNAPEAVARTWWQGFQHELAVKKTVSEF